MVKKEYFSALYKWFNFDIIENGLLFNINKQNIFSLLLKEAKMGGWCNEESFSDYTFLYGLSLDGETASSTQRGGGGGRRRSFRQIELKFDFFNLTEYV